MLYEGIKYGTKVLVTSGFYEGQIVTVVSWREWNRSRHYSVRFDDGMCRWLSCDVLSDRLEERYFMGKDTYQRLIRADKEPIQHDMLCALNRTNDELRGKMEVISKLYRELDMKYITALKEIESMKNSAPNPKYVAALKRFYEHCNSDASIHFGEWVRVRRELMREVRRFRP